MLRRLVPTVLCLLLACDAAGDPELPPEEVDAGKADGAAAWLVDGTPEAVGVLRMLADPFATQDVLDIDAGLDARAADNLVAHRNGPDGVYEEGHGDDEPFTSIAQVDAVPWVGPSALGKLLDFALQNDFVPGGNQYLGTWDGVDFSAIQAQRVVDFVNASSDDELYDALKDSRAHASLLSVRPVASVAQVAAAKWIGPAMLGRLVDASAPEVGGEACQSNADCPGNLACIGKPQNHPWGLCRDLTPIAGEDDMCLVDDDCEVGLACSGLTIFDEGFCRPQWMFTTIEDGGVGSIPGIVMTEPMGLGVTAVGLATVPEDIVVRVGLSHTHPESLWIGLRDPNGSEATLWDGPHAGGAAFPESMIPFGDISRDDAVNGQWTLLVRNVDGLGEGVIDGWSLQLSSRWD